VNGRWLVKPQGVEEVHAGNCISDKRYPKSSGHQVLMKGYGLQVQFLYFLSCPGSSAQEFQARFDAGILSKAFDGDAPAQFLPAMFFYKSGEDHFEGDAV
jgi:hypothetical protein